MFIFTRKKGLFLFFDDLRPYAIQFVPCIAIPIMAILLPPMYTHSTYWLWAAAFYLIAKIEEAADTPIYKWTHHVVSGHTLKHLCAAVVPVFLTLMLAKRTIDLERYFLYNAIFVLYIFEFVQFFLALSFSLPLLLYLSNLVAIPRMQAKFAGDMEGFLEPVSREEQEGREL
ncbi:uncharacterized protein LOC116188859 [Punica granatum]|uniref:Uncharacterized protein LOC116188859 n=1 Tax=Punica granatum TaxID=22663 RepID=A0A6P8BV56_PUNGR|nr:uncharacterized protein LOC116188859 [Punica granatum]